MKKTLIIAAVSALAAGSALAQSSVTVYGRLNVSGERENRNGTSIYKLDNDASRWGLLGVEDLGGGLKAGFQLESGFSADTGAANNPFWGRQSEVNLGGGFGMVRLGNFQSEAYFATADYVSMHNHDTGNSEDALYAFDVGQRTNKVAYRLPTFVPGLQVEGAVAAAEGQANTKRTYDGAINYKAGGLALGLGYAKENTASQVGVRGLYNFGSFVIGGYVQRDTNGWGDGSSGYGQAHFPVDVLGTRTTYRISGAYFLGASEFHLNFGDAGKYSKVANSSAKQFTAAYNYNLSKRTKLYAYYTEVKDSAANIYNKANFGIAATGLDTKFSSIALGIRHNF